jgi:leucyl-tRNA synthetase
MINQGMILGRSSLVNRLLTTTGGTISVDEKRDIIPADIVPAVFISANCNEIIQKYNTQRKAKTIDIDSNLSAQYHIIKSKITELENNIFDSINPNAEFAGRVSITLDSVFQIYADISFVDNDKLDIEAFKNWRSEYKNAEFILEDDGSYICGSEVEKMSKSKYNVQTPDELVEKFGADTLRMYEMFLGPLEQFKPWDTKGINGVHNFLRKLWRLFYNEGQSIITDAEPSKDSLKTLHKTIKKIEEDLERFSFNTGVSNFMICVNELTEQKCHSRAVLEQLVVLLSPYAPHVAEELWEALGNKAGSISATTFPTFNPDFLVEANFAYPVSFNGKMRFSAELPTAMNAQEVQAAVMAMPEAEKWLEGKEPKKVIVVPGRIVNIVV